MNAVTLRIISDTIIEFDTMETVDCSVLPLRQFLVSQEGKETAFETGRPWLVVQVRIKESCPQTRAKVNAVYRNTGKMNVSCNLNTRDEKSITAFILPVKKETISFFGRRMPSEHVLTFMECE